MMSSWPTLRQMSSELFGLRIVKNMYSLDLLLRALRPFFAIFDLLRLRTCLLQKRQRKPAKVARKFFRRASLHLLLQLRQQIQGFKWGDRIQIEFAQLVQYWLRKRSEDS